MNLKLPLKKASELISYRRILIAVLLCIVPIWSVGIGRLRPSVMVLLTFAGLLLCLVDANPIAIVRRRAPTWSPTKSKPWLCAGFVVFTVMAIGLAILFCTLGRGNVWLATWLVLDIWLALTLRPRRDACLQGRRASDNKPTWSSHCIDILKGVLTCLIAVILMSSPASPSIAPQGIVVDPLDSALKKIDEKTASANTEPSRSQRIQLTTRDQAKINEINSKGNALDQALVMLSLAQSAQSRGFLVEADRRIAKVEGLRSLGIEYLQISDDRTYELVKGCRAIIVGDVVAAVTFMERAYRLDSENAHVDALLCKALLDSGEAESNAERIVAIADSALRKLLSDQSLVGDLTCEKATALFLLGRVSSATAVLTTLGESQDIVSKFDSHDASQILALRGQLQICVGEVDDGVGNLEQARRIASASGVISPDLACIYSDLAHTYVAIGKIANAEDVIVDYADHMSDAVFSGSTTIPFILSAAADVAANKAVEQRTEQHPQGEPTLWEKATTRQRKACNLFRMYFGECDHRTIEAHAELAAMLERQGKHEESRLAMSPITCSFQDGHTVHHPCLPQSYLGCSLILAIPLAQQSDDCTLSMRDPDVRIGTQLAESAYDCAMSMQRDAMTGLSSPYRYKTALAMQCTDAQALAIEWYLLAKKVAKALEASRALVTWRKEIYGATHAKYWSAVAMLGRAELANGLVSDAEMHLVSAYGAIGENADVPIRLRWAMCRGLCRLYKQLGKRSDADRWRERAQRLIPERAIARASETTSQL